MAPRASRSVQKCLEHLIVLIGLYTLENEENQQRLNWGSGDTLLSRLSSLPFKYFCDEKLKEQLFPTLISATAFNDVNRDVVSNDISIELLAGFLNDKMKGDTGSKEAIALSHRIPYNSWVKMKSYYE